MQEDDDELRQEDRMEKSGYTDWLSDNIGDLKAEYMAEHSTEYLIQHFYWNQESMEDFWNQHEEELDTLCKESWDNQLDIQQTGNNYIQSQIKNI